MAAFGLMLVFTTPLWGLPSDRRAPIQISTREAVRDEVAGTTTYRGDVHFRQGTLEIRADEVTVESRGAEPDRLTAIGTPAQVEQVLREGEPRVHAEARRIVYVRNDGLLRLRGDCVLRQGETTLHSAIIDYHAEEQTIEAYADPSSGQRVRSVIPPGRLDISPQE